MANNYIKFYLRDSLKYLDYNIQALAYNYSFPELSNKNVDNNFRKWRRLDNRFNDLFGSTYEVPLGDYKQHTDDIRILISGDRFLQCSSARLHIFDIPDISAECDDIGEVSDMKLYVDDLDTMSTILSKAYPNATIDLLGEFDKQSKFEADLVQLLDYLNDKIANDKELPTHIIFNGLEKTYEKFGYDTTYEVYQSILNICRNNHINIVCVLCCPNYITKRSYEDIFTLELIKLVNMLSNSYVVNLYSWLKSREVSYNNAVNFVDSLYGIQMDIAYNYIYDSCFKKLGLDVFRYKYYVSFVDMEIDAPTTMNTITKNSNQSYLYFKTAYPKPTSSTNLNYVTKYGGSEGMLNAFKNSGEFVAVVVHTEYNDALFANEQFQANCNTEFVAENDGYSENGVLQNLLRLRCYSTDGEQGYYPVPVYPTAGAPWLTISKKNIREYSNYNVPQPYTPIGVWLTRDNYSMTITTNLRPVFDDKLDLYQNVVFGCMDIKPINHVHNLYCGGGSGGLSQDIFVHQNTRTGRLQYTAGNVYDLDMDNIAMSNSNILHTTKFNKSTTSNFRVLASDGIWKDIFVHKQDASAVSYPTLGYPEDWAYVLNNVTDYFSEHSIYPRMSNDCKRLSSKYIKTNGYVNVVGKNELVNECKFSDYTQRIRVNLNPNMPHNEYSSTGTIPHCFVAWDDECPAGEVMIGGKKYLSIPCGWEGRLYNYGPEHIGVVNDVWNTESVVDDWERRTTLRKENVIRDKLLIELGG